MRDEFNLEPDECALLVCISLFGMGCLTGYCVARAVQEMLL